jgi:hypothetical protein
MVDVDDTFLEPGAEVDDNMREELGMVGSSFQSAPVAGSALPPRHPLRVPEVRMGLADAALVSKALGKPKISYPMKLRTGAGKKDFVRINFEPNAGELIITERKRLGRAKILFRLPFKTGMELEAMEMDKKRFLVAHPDLPRPLVLSAHAGTKNQPLGVLAALMARFNEANALIADSAEAAAASAGADRPAFVGMTQAPTPATVGSQRSVWANLDQYEETDDEGTTVPDSPFMSGDSGRPLSVSGPRSPPPPPEEEPAQMAVVRHDYVPTDARMLPLTKGQRLQILGEDSGWLIARSNDGAEGYVPPGFVTVLQE